MEESDVTNLDGIGIQKQAGKLTLICIISTLSTHNTKCLFQDNKDL